MDELIKNIIQELLNQKFSPILSQLERINPQQSPWLTVKEAAERLKVSTTTIRKMIDSGDLPFYQRVNGGCIRLRVEDVDMVLVVG